MSLNRYSQRTSGTSTTVQPRCATSARNTPSASWGNLSNRAGTGLRRVRNRTPGSNTVSRVDWRRMNSPALTTRGARRRGAGAGITTLPCPLTLSSGT